MKSYSITPIDEHLAKKLQQFRISAGVTQEELGDLVGVTMQQIQKYEMAKNRICASRLFEFAQLLDKPIQAFFDGLKADRSYYNYDFQTEKKRAKKDLGMSSEFKALVNSFNRIENPATRKHIITLLNGIAKPKRKKIKHCYS